MLLKNTLLRITNNNSLVICKTDSSKATVNLKPKTKNDIMATSRIIFHILRECSCSQMTITILVSSIVVKCMARERNYRPISHFRESLTKTTKNMESLLLRISNIKARLGKKAVFLTVMDNSVSKMGKNTSETSETASFMDKVCTMTKITIWDMKVVGKIAYTTVLESITGRMNRVLKDNIIMDWKMDRANTISKGRSRFMEYGRKDRSLQGTKISHWVQHKMWKTINLLILLK